jgi:hypothetical protein
MPKFPVVDANPTAEQRKARECERSVAEVVRALSANDVESAARAFEAAVQRGGNEFLEYCRKLPPEVRSMLADVAKSAI